MKAQISKILVTFLIATASLRVLANSNSNRSQDKRNHISLTATSIPSNVFILQKENEPVIVVPESSPIVKENKIMRMPDLNGEAIESIGLARKQSKTHGQVKGSLSSAPSDKAKFSPKAKPMQFSSAKISGKIRLPRIKFAKLAIPMELRDESPSLDFTGKSLASGGL